VHHKLHLVKRLLPWCAALVITSLAFATIWIVALQFDRLAAVETPERLASQVAAEIRGGQTSTIDAQPHVDLSRSLAAFVVVENAQGSATSGSGYLSNALVSLPTETLGRAAASGTAFDSWEPRPGLRFATVTVRVGDQFVSAGQSLSPTESRDASFAPIIGGAWLLALIALGAAFAAWWRTPWRVTPTLSASASPSTQEVD
jgi:hypothetical protein